MRNIHAFIEQALTGYKKNGHRLQPATLEWTEARNALRVFYATAKKKVSFATLPGEIQYSNGEVARWEKVIPDEYFNRPELLRLLL